jgi:hypothetical protein
MGGDSKRGKSGGAMGTCGSLWFIGWLFTIAFAHLTFWKGFLAILFWPYFLGLALR